MADRITYEDLEKMAERLPAIYPKYEPEKAHWCLFCGKILKLEERYIMYGHVFCKKHYDEEKAFWERMRNQNYKREEK